MVAVVKGLVVGAAAVNAGAGGWLLRQSTLVVVVTVVVSVEAASGHGCRRRGTSLQYNPCSSHDYASRGFKKG